MAPIVAAADISQLSMSNLENQKQLKSFIDKEISLKVKNIVKEQVVKLFSEFIQKQEELDQ